jgi:glutathione synthase
MDPLHRIHVGGDSTYMLMRECSDRGFPVWMCTPDVLSALRGEPRAMATPVRTTGSAPHFHVGAPEVMPLSAFDVVWMRKDPPFDMSYVFSTYLLDMAPPSTLVVNDPIGLKRFNEKLFAMRFGEFHPPSLLSRNKAEIVAFVRSLAPGRAVLKPWDGNGGRGVVVTDGSDRNLPSLVELLTAEGTMHLIAQAYVPGITRGDKRIILFDGEPVGAILRVPGEQDHRGNIHVGATVHKTTLDARDQAICAAIGPVLRAEGLMFVGIDVIDGWLTEINVTSPTGIQEINRLYGLKLEADLVDRVLAKHRGLRADRL